jgi:hypothetical protein
MEKSCQLHAPATLSPGKEPLVPTGEEAGWAPKPVWTQWWREKFPAPAETQTPNYPAFGPVLYHWAIPAPVYTELKKCPLINCIYLYNFLKGEMTY